MIRRIRSTLLSIRYNYTNPVEQQRAVRLVYIIWFLIFVAITFVPIGALSDQATSQFSSSLISATMTTGVCLFMYFLIQNGQVQTASWLLLAFLFVALYPVVTSTRGVVDVVLAIPLTFAGILLGWRGLAVSLVAITVILSQRELLLPFEERYPAGGMFGLISVFGIIAAILWTFSTSLQEIVNRSVSDTRRFQKIGAFTSGLNLSGDEQNILLHALTLLRDDMNYPYSQIFLLNENERVSQRLRSGLGTGQMIVSTDLELHPDNIIMEAIREQTPVTVSRYDPGNTHTHFIQTTTYGIAVPIILYNRIYGVLDVQKERAEAFTADEITTLATIVDQITFTITQYRTIQALRSEISDQQSNIDNMRDQLNKLRQREQQTSQSTWDSYLQKSGQGVLGYDIQKDSGFTLANDLPDTLRQAMSEGQIVIQQEGDQQIVSIPIIYGDQMLGAMSLTIPADRIISDRQLDMLELISRRLGLALENKRLFEQSQAQAQREATANETANLLLGAADVESVLRIAAESFTNALNAVNTTIQVEPGILIQKQEDELDKEQAI